MRKTIQPTIRQVRPEDIEGLAQFLEQNNSTVDTADVHCSAAHTNGSRGRHSPSTSLCAYCAGRHVCWWFASR